MKLSNNSLNLNKGAIEKYFADIERFRREKYFYLTFKNKKLNIPKVISIKKNKIIFKKYKFKLIKSQKLFLDELLVFLIKLNKQKKYNLRAKENLHSYKDLLSQIKKRFKKISRAKVDKKLVGKMKIIKKYIKNILKETPRTAKLAKCTKIISQSDIGFHNCGINNGKVFFYDFEYAGYDHPIKLICDTYYQPEKRVHRDNILEFINKFEKKFNFKLPENFYLFEKLLKVKMMLIILNILIVSNIRNISKQINNDDLDKLKLKRINKVLKYTKYPFIHEQ